MVISGQTHDPVQVIDTLPLPVCVLTRALSDFCFKTTVDFGYCAAEDMHYCGFKSILRISRLGMITHCPLLDGFEGLAPADKGFVDAYRQALLFNRIGSLSSHQFEKICKSICQVIFYTFANGPGSFLKRLAHI